LPSNNRKSHWYIVIDFKEEIPNTYQIEMKKIVTT